MSEEEERVILSASLRAQGYTPLVMRDLLDLHRRLATALPPPARPSLRPLLRLAQCLTSAADPLRALPVAAGLLYADCQVSPSDRDALRACIADVLKVTPAAVAGSLPKPGPAASAASEAARARGFCDTQYTGRLLSRLALAVETGCLVLLEGPTCSGKTELVLRFAQEQVCGRLTTAMQGECPGSP